MKRHDAELLNEEELAKQSSGIIKHQASLMSFWETNCLVSSYVISEWNQVNRDFLVRAVRRLNEVTEEQSFEEQKHKIAEITPELLKDYSQKMAEFAYTASAVSGALFHRSKDLVKTATEAAQADAEAMAKAREERAAQASAQPDEQETKSKENGSSQGSAQSQRNQER